MNGEDLVKVIETINGATMNGEAYHKTFCKLEASNPQP